MPLREITLDLPETPLPDKLASLIDEAEDAIAVFQEGVGEQACPLFEPAEYAEVAEVLLALHAAGRRGTRFCEWGCGFGVVTAIAALIGFDAVGIEHDGLLLDQARAFQNQAEVAYRLEQADLFALSESENRDMGPATFDVIYAYPWPREAPDWIRFFEATARAGALLVAFEDFGIVRVWEKIS